MKNKYIFGGIIIAVFFTLMILLFTQTSVRYEEDFRKIKSAGKSFKATGAWVREKSYDRNSNLGTFSFYMEDAYGEELKVIYKGNMPNNFESATSVVVTGRYQDGVFVARDILTKCPSKYEEEFKDERLKPSDT